MKIHWIGLFCLVMSCTPKGLETPYLPPGYYFLHDPKLSEMNVKISSREAYKIAAKNLRMLKSLDPNQKVFVGKACWSSKGFYHFYIIKKVGPLSLRPFKVNMVTGEFYHQN